MCPQNQCGPQEKKVLVLQPGREPCSYTIQMGDELLVAPLSLFYPDLLKLTGKEEVINEYKLNILIGQTTS